MASLIPYAKASSVAAASQGSNCLTRARNRVGLARSIKGMGDYVAVLCGGGNAADSAVVSFHAMPQRRGGGERPDGDARKRERPENGEGSDERHRPRDGGIGGSDAEDENGHRQRQHENGKQNSAAPQRDRERGADHTDEGQRRSPGRERERHRPGRGRVEVEEQPEQGRRNNQRNPSG